MPQVTTTSQGTKRGVEKHHTWFHGWENRVRFAQTFREGWWELEGTWSSLHKPTLALHRAHPRCFTELKAALQHLGSKSTDGWLRSARCSRACWIPPQLNPSSLSTGQRCHRKALFTRKHVHFGVKCITVGKAARLPCTAESSQGFLPAPACSKAKPGLPRWVKDHSQVVWS